MIQAFLAVVLNLAGSFQQIISYFFFVTVVFIGMTVAGLFIIRRRPFAGYRTPLFPLTPIAFLAITSLVLLLLLLKDPVRSVLGVAVVLLGLPVYYYFFGRKEI